MTPEQKNDLVTAAFCVASVGDATATINAADQERIIGLLESLPGEIERMRDGYKMLSSIVHDLTVANQAAWIEWRHGKGAEAAMVWVHNGLVGPGHIPDERKPWGKEAQAWYDANCSEPLPMCHCGRPANIGSMDKGFCSMAHLREGKAADNAQGGAEC